MKYQLILATVLLLTTCAPAKTQTLTTTVFLVPPRVEPATSWVRTSRSRFSKNVSRTTQLPSEPAPRLTAPAIPAYLPDRNSEGGSLVDHVSTPFLTESRLAVAEFWKGRLQINGFESTRHMQNEQFGPPGYITLPPSHDQAGLANSGGSDGISLVLSFGRHARSTSQPEAWRCVEWIKSDESSCPF
jgi:hypothetical protein